MSVFRISLVHVIKICRLSRSPDPHLRAHLYDVYDVSGLKGLKSLSPDDTSRLNGARGGHSCYPHYRAAGENSFSVNTAVPQAPETNVKL